MQATHKLLFVMFVFSLTACSGYAYKQAQNHHKQRCTSKPTMQEYEECMAQIETSYEEYEKIRNQEE